jgi:hypothetical protein
MKDYENLIPIHLTGFRTRYVPGGSLEPYLLRYRGSQFLCFNGFSDVLSASVLVRCFVRVV